VLAADEIVIDLEDSVPADQKDDARRAVVDALGQDEWAAATVSVRVNATSSPWFEDDLRALGSAGQRLDSVIVPKAENPGELHRVAELLAAGGRARPVAVQALIESARGLRDVNAIAEAAPLEALILGPADMSVSLGFPSPEEGSRWDFARGTVLVAARAAGVQAIDGPYLRIGDADGLLESAGRARELGFDGKWALHPDQVEPLNRVFTPGRSEIEQARAIIEALELASDGAATLDGEMIDEASHKRAEAVLARAEAAGATR
jgi:citrate lyase subunit beta/citryl-CoA lyase